MEDTLMAASDDQVRLDILELLHKHQNDSPNNSGVDRAIIQDTLKVSEKHMEINISYLEDKALVTLSRTFGPQWTFAKITPEGINVIENKERYADKFSFVKASTSQNNEEDHQNVSQELMSSTGSPQRVAEFFKQARDQVRDAKLSKADKEKLEKQLRVLETELLKNKRADLGKIQKEWESLKKNASWLSPTISQAVLEAIRQALDI
jgi:hypothetical protein